MGKPKYDDLVVSGTDQVRVDALATQLRISIPTGDAVFIVSPTTTSDETAGIALIRSPEWWTVEIDGELDSMTRAYCQEQWGATVDSEVETHSVLRINNLHIPDVQLAQFVDWIMTQGFHSGSYTVATEGL